MTCSGAGEERCDAGQETTSPDPYAAGRPAAAADPNSAAIRVIVVDDQDIVRDGLVTVLSLLPGLEVVGAASDGPQAIDLVAEHHPEVALMDLRMPGMDGTQATATIIEQFPQVAVLVLTTFDDDSSISEALRAGARGYLTKDASRDDIAAAIRSVARGQATFDAAVSAKLVSGLSAAKSATGHESAGNHNSGDQDQTWRDHATEAGTPELWQLTARERQVLRLIGTGLNNSEIAEELFVSTATVKTHINNLFAKLGIRDRAQAVHLANRAAR